MDYDTLAKQFGGQVNTGGGIDYGSLANQFGIQQSSTTPSVVANKRNPLLGIAGAIVNTPLESVVRPGVRFGQAIGQSALELGALTGNKKAIAARDRGLELIGKDTKTSFGFPGQGITVKGVKKFGEGGGKQIVGEGAQDLLNAASFKFAPNVGAGLFKNAGSGIVRGGVVGALRGATTGAVTGGLYGAGYGVSKGLQNNQDLAGIVGSGVQGGAVGAVTGGVVGGAVGGVTGAVKGGIQRHREIEEGIRAAKQPANIIEYSKNPNGGAKVDPVAKEALKQGYDPRDIQLIKNADETTSKSIREMTRIADEGSKVRVPDKLSVEVPGKVMVDYAKDINKVRTQVGKELGEVARSMPQTPIDVTPTVQKFAENLDDAGIGINGKELIFDGSRYADQKGVQKQLQDAWVAISDGSLTPDKIIGTRQKMFTNLKYAKQANEIVPGDFASTMIDDVYNTLDDPLKTMNTQYGELAQKYAQASSAIRDFGGAIGKNFDLSDEITNLRAGEVGAGVAGNVPARKQALINSLQDTAKALGIENKGDIKSLFYYADFLDNAFGTTQPGSFKGRVTSGVLDAQDAIDVAKSVAGGSKNLTGMGIDLAKKGYALSRGINSQARVDVLKRLVGLTGLVK